MYSATLQTWRLNVISGSSVACGTGYIISDLVVTLAMLNKFDELLEFDSIMALSRVMAHLLDWREGIETGPFCRLRVRILDLEIIKARPMFAAPSIFMRLALRK
jgi:hypothetical protein